jgi:hypothetical protein
MYRCTDVQDPDQREPWWQPVTTWRYWRWVMAITAGVLVGLWVARALEGVR